MTASALVFRHPSTSTALSIPTSPPDHIGPRHHPLMPSVQLPPSPRTMSTSTQRPYIDIPVSSRSVRLDDPSPPRGASGSGATSAPAPGGGGITGGPFVSSSPRSIDDGGSMSSRHYPPHYRHHSYHPHHPHHSSSDDDEDARERQRIQDRDSAMALVVARTRSGSVVLAARPSLLSPVSARPMGDLTAPSASEGVRAYH